MKTLEKQLYETNNRVAFVCNETFFHLSISFKNLLQTNFANGTEAVFLNCANSKLIFGKQI